MNDYNRGKRDIMLEMANDDLVVRKQCGF